MAQLRRGVAWRGTRQRRYSGQRIESFENLKGANDEVKLKLVDATANCRNSSEGES